MFPRSRSGCVESHRSSYTGVYPQRHDTVSCPAEPGHVFMSCVLSVGDDTRRHIETLSQGVVSVGVRTRHSVVSVEVRTRLIYLRQSIDESRLAHINVLHKSSSITGTQILYYYMSHKCSTFTKSSTITRPNRVLISVARKQPIDSFVETNR